MLWSAACHITYDKSNELCCIFTLFAALNQIKLGFWPHFVSILLVEFFLPRNFLELEAGHFPYGGLRLLLQKFYCFFPWKRNKWWDDAMMTFSPSQKIACWTSTRKNSDFYNGHNNDITIKKTIVFIFNRKTFCVFRGNYTTYRFYRRRKNKKTNRYFIFHVTKVIMLSVVSILLGPGRSLLCTELISILGHCCILKTFRPSAFLFSSLF